MSRYAVDTVALQDRADLVRIFVFKIRLLADHLPDQILLKWCKIRNSPARNPVEGQGINVAGCLSESARKLILRDQAPAILMQIKIRCSVWLICISPTCFLGRCLFTGFFGRFGFFHIFRFASCSDAPASPVSSTV